MNNATTKNPSRTAEPRTCPAWCTDHDDRREPREWMAEHQDAVRTSYATHGEIDEPEPVTVRTAQWEDEDGAQPRRVVLAVPADLMGETHLDAGQAEALVGTLQAALAALRDG